MVTQLTTLGNMSRVGGTCPHAISVELVVSPILAGGLCGVSRFLQRDV